MAMTMPTINIVFSKAAQSTAARSGRGAVGLVIRDAAASKGVTLYSAADVPEGLSADNQAYVKRVFLGADGVRPVRCHLYVLAAAGSLSEALSWLSLQTFSWLALPLDVKEADLTEAKEWINSQRSENNAVYKAVLPNFAGADQRIVNFAASGIKADGTTYGAAAYCSRIAGILAALPLTQSATYCVLEEVTDVERMTRSAMNDAVEAGKLILHVDGSRVKLGRAVSSMTEAASEDMRHIRTLEIQDTVESNLRQLIADEFIGKFTNTYANKLVLVTAVRDYLMGLESEGVLDAGSTCALDAAATRVYLQGKGVSVAGMDDNAVLQQSTGTAVFLTVTLKIPGAVEDVTVNIAV